MTLFFRCYAITRAHGESMQRRVKCRNAGLPCCEVAVGRRWTFLNGIWRVKILRIWAGVRMACI
ncbi:hypothetical protein A9827_22670 [Salmonella enterica]|nr:hypothetical protein [Salmonella enterica]